MSQPGASLDREAAMATRTVGILIFDDVEVLDFAGPFDVFGKANAIPRGETEPAPFDVRLIAEEQRPYRASASAPGQDFLISPHFTFGTAPKLDMVLVPGGQGTRVEDQNRVLLDWLTKTSPTAEIAASVCTGSFLYAAAGLLDGRRATTHHWQLDRLRQTYPEITVVDGVRWVDDGQVVSSAGVSAGIDMSLHVVARLLGRDFAARVARAMQYEGRWESPG